MRLARSAPTARRVLLTLLTGLIALGVLLMHTQLGDGSSATSARHTARPDGPTLVARTGPARIVASMQESRTSADPSVAAAPSGPTTDRGGRPAPMPAMPGHGSHAAELCVAILSGASLLLLLLGSGLLVRSARWRLLSARLRRAGLLRGRARPPSRRQALTLSDLCLLRT